MLLFDEVKSGAIMNLKMVYMRLMLLMCGPLLISCASQKLHAEVPPSLVFDAAEIVAVPDTLMFRVGPSESELLEIGCHFTTAEMNKIRYLLEHVSSSKLEDRRYPYYHFSAATGILLKYNGVVVDKYFFSREDLNGEIWGVRRQGEGGVFSKYRSSLHGFIQAEIKNRSYLVANDVEQSGCEF